MQSPFRGLGCHEISRIFRQKLPIYHYHFCDDYGDWSQLIAQYAQGRRPSFEGNF